MRECQKTEQRNRRRALLRSSVSGRLPQDAKNHEMCRAGLRGLHPNACIAVHRASRPTNCSQKNTDKSYFRPRVGSRLHIFDLKIPSEITANPARNKQLPTAPPVSRHPLPATRALSRPLGTIGKAQVAGSMALHLPRVLAPISRCVRFL